MSFNKRNLARVDLQNRNEIAQGKRTQEDKMFAPSIIGYSAGVPDVKHPENFSRPENTRTEARFRVQQYMEDPKNAKITDNWMDNFNNPQFGQEVT
jgi:hypothetical protein